MSSLDESRAAHNNQLAFSILERELGIPPVMSASDLANSGQIDKLSMVLYLTQVQDAFTVLAKDKTLGTCDKKNRASISSCVSCSL